MLAKVLLINLVIYCANGVKHSENNAVLSSMFQKLQSDETLSNVESSEQTYRPGIDVELKNHINAYYRGEIIVGTTAPGAEDQKLSVVFDTGSVDLWIPSVEACLTGGVTCDPGHSQKGFDATKSITYRPLNQPYFARYQDGLQIRGYVGSDVLKIRSVQSEILVPTLTFALVESLTNDNDKADGIFGLGFATLSSIHGNTESPFESMTRQANLKPQFGFFFNNRNDPGDNKFGHLFLGGYDESLVESEFTFSKVFKNSISYTSWEIIMDGVTVGASTQALAVGVRALIDSATSSIQVPSGIFQSILNQMPIEYVPTLREGSFECGTIDLAKLPKITFIINNTPLELDPVDYIEGEDYQPAVVSDLYYILGTSCFFMLNEMASEPEDTFFILGVPFMRKFYTLFDMGKKEIGFARARHGPKDNNVITETSRNSNSIDNTLQTFSNTNVPEKPKTSSEKPKKSSEKPKTSSEKPKTSSEKPKPNKSQPHSEVSGKDTAPFFENHSILGRLFGGSSRR